MLGQPVRAFVVQRADEVASLGAVPEALRAQHFVEKSVRPMTDCVLAATKITWPEDDPLAQKLGARFQKHRKRVEDVRITLGARVERAEPHSISSQPATRIAREKPR
jgi:hypothetical protein